ncbi:MAG: hypothetical protein IPP77_09395 [Bacteroidetes bacterium]|nr:hypothetical protein [Bacteroidota bacterium]
MKHPKKEVISRVNHSTLHRYAGVLVFLFASLLYVNTVPNNYSLDDEFIARQEYSAQKGLKAISEILTTPYFVMGGKKHEDYRPLAKISYAIEFIFFDENPHISHFIQALLYGVVCTLLFYLLGLVFPSYHSLLPLSAALLFAAHPIHTEVVASLKNREELFSLLFSFGTLYFMIKAMNEKRKVFWIFAIISYLLAIMSKQSSWIVVFWAPLVLYFAHRDAKPVSLSFIGLGLLLVTVAYTLVVQHYILNAPLFSTGRTYDFVENPLTGNPDFWLRTGTSMNCLGFYLTKMIYPHPLSWYYGYDMIPLQKIWELRPLFYLAVHLALFVFALFGIRERRPFSLAILMYLLALAPYSNILLLAPGIVAERLALFASVGFCLALALLLFRLSEIDYRKPLEKIKPLFWILLVPVLLFYSIKTYSRNADWKDYLSLFGADMGHLENSYVAHNNYAEALFDAIKKGQQPATEETLQKVMNHNNRALEIYPNGDATMARVAQILSGVYHNNTEAVKYLRKAVELKPESRQYRYDLAYCYFSMKQYDSSAVYYKEAIQLDTTYLAPMVELAVLYSEIGQQDSAIYYNQKALQRAPNLEAGVANMGFFYKKAGDSETARKYFEKALTINPKRQDVVDAIKEIDIAAEKPSP